MNKPFSELNPDLVAQLKALLGPKGYSEDPAVIAPHVEDWRGNFKGHSSLLLLPASTKEVAGAVKLCAEFRQPITPQSGNTGLVNGGIAYGEVVLSLKRMNKIRSADRFNNSITVEAGCILAAVHEAAEKEDRFFPLSLGSQGSCMIGGLISTNAGGVNVLRYGMMRDLILGLEVVTPQGEIWSGLRGLRKDNTGYDLKQLFCGGEGTLGVITAATLKLFPVPKKATGWLTVDTPQKAVELLSLVRDVAGDTVTSFEFMPRSGVELTAREIEHARDPMPSEAPWRVLVEISMSDEKNASEMLEKALEAAFEADIITDGVIATSLSQAEDFWTIRESLPLVKRSYLTSVNFDISVPISSIPQFLERCEAILKERFDDIEIFAFGHLGDGNLHYAVAEANDAENPKVRANKDEITAIVHGLTTELGGSISAEHGVGLLKRDELPEHKSDVEMTMMRTIKQALDPDNIMNPGRILQIIPNESQQ